MNIPTTAKELAEMKHEQNHIAEIIQVANGEMLKKEYAELIGVDPTRLSARLADDYARAIKKLQAEKIELQSTCKQLQNEALSLQASINNLKAERKQLQESQMELQEVRNDLHADNANLEAVCNNLKAENKALQQSNGILQATVGSLESRVLQLTDKPQVIRFFGSPSVRAFLAVLLAFFEMAGSMHLLWPKGALLAVPVGVAMGFSLLAFASSDNALGKWVCIVFSFAVGIIYFEPWVTGLPGDWLFAFVPPIVNATIINSFNKNV